jgi:hypothetical protein
LELSALTDVKDSDDRWPCNPQPLKTSCRPLAIDGTPCLLKTVEAMKLRRGRIKDGQVVETTP